MSASKSEKTMSSRLMNMKFMQRASANPSKVYTSSAESSPAKRRKVDIHTSSPGTDAEKTKQHEALDAFEVKRLQALEKQGREFGETKWVLKRDPTTAPAESSSRLQIRVAGYGIIDSVPESDHDPSADAETHAGRLIGRTTFGNFRPAGQNSISAGEDEEPSDDNENGDPSDADSAGEGDNASDSAGSTPSKAKEIRERMRAKRKAQQAEILRLAERRRSKEVKLSNLSSISAQGRPSKPNTASIKCFRCGEMGHTKKQCPK